MKVILFWVTLVLCFKFCFNFNFLNLSNITRLYFIFKLEIGICMISVILVFWGIQWNLRRTGKTYSSIYGLKWVYVLVGINIATFSCLDLSCRLKYHDVDGCSLNWYLYGITM